MVFFVHIHVQKYLMDKKNCIFLTENIFRLPLNRVGVKIWNDEM